MKNNHRQQKPSSSRCSHRAIWRTPARPLYLQARRPCNNGHDLSRELWGACLTGGRWLKCSLTPFINRWSGTSSPLPETTWPHLRGRSSPLCCERTPLINKDQALSHTTGIRISQSKHNNPHYPHTAAHSSTPLHRSRGANNKTASLPEPNRDG